MCGGKGLPRKSEEWSPDPWLCLKTQYLSLCLSLLIYKMRGLDPVTSGISFTDLLNLNTCRKNKKHQGLESLAQSVSDQSEPFDF